MTWNQLLHIIYYLNFDQRETDVTVKINDEFYKVNCLKITVDNDILDSGHPFLAQSTLYQVIK